MPHERIGVWPVASLRRGHITGPRWGRASLAQRWVKPTSAEPLPSRKLFGRGDRVHRCGMHRLMIIIACLAVAGCSSADSDSTGSGGASSSKATTASASTGASQGAECLEKLTQQECDATDGCIWATGRLFEPANDCTDMTPIGACALKNAYAHFGGGSLLRRDVPEGRIVIEYPRGVPPVPDGFVECQFCMLEQPCDWCACAD